MTLKLGQRGNIIIFILIAFAIIAFIPPLLMHLFPAAGLLFQVIMIFVIFMTVRQLIGDGIPTYIVSGILIYYLVFIYRDIASSVFVLQLLLTFGFGSVVMWGIGTRLK